MNEAAPFVGGRCAGGNQFSTHAEDWFQCPLPQLAGLLHDVRLGERFIGSWLQHHQVFAIDLPDGGIRYPAFQFQLDGTPWPVLAEVLPRVQAAFEPRDLLMWFNAPQRTLRGDKPRTRLDHPALIVAAVNDTLTPIDFY